MRITLPALAALATCAGLAGCGSGTTAPARAAGSPAITKQQAQQVLSEYESVNNRANSALDATLLGSIETGPQLAMDSASYKLHRVTKVRYAEFTFAKPAFYIPRLTAYPRWFAVDAVSTPTPGENGKAQQVHNALLFQQEAPGTPWRLAADPYVTGASTPLSDIALDPEGYAMPVSPDATGLAVAPSKVAPAHAGLLTSGTSAPGAAALASGPQTSQAYDALQQARGGFAKLGVILTSRFAPSGQPTYALRTSEGGAVVWYVLQQQETYASKKPGTISISGDLVGLAPSGKVDKRLDTTVLVQYLADVPAQGKVGIGGMYRKAVQAEAS